MSEWTYLSASDQLADRPFTNPELTWQDQQALQAAVEQLRRLLTFPQVLHGCGLAEQIHWVTEQERQHRFVMVDSASLLALTHCVLVGFFGTRRVNAVAEQVNELDGELLQEVLGHSGLLCYCSLHLENGEYGNLVLFCDERAKLHWATSQRHLFAARELSPKYYEYVRLHNGHLPGGLLAGSAPVIERTKYLDYRGMLPWRGQREFVAEASCAVNDGKS